MKAKSEPSDGRVRLMQQVRAGTGFKYFFMLRGVVLTIAITPRKNGDDPSDWRVDVNAGREEQEVLVTEWGDTRGAALCGAGTAWANATTTDTSIPTLPDFDWSVVTEALSAVRAI